MPGRGVSTPEQAGAATLSMALTTIPLDPLNSTICAHTYTQVTPIVQQPTPTRDPHTQCLNKDTHPGGLWAWRFWIRLKPVQAGSWCLPTLGRQGELWVPGCPPPDSPFKDLSHLYMHQVLRPGCPSGIRKLFFLASFNQITFLSLHPTDTLRQALRTLRHTLLGA